ncbi:Solute carrier family 35 member B1 like [Pseudolycoriella hygida]|uniref:Solute carrier family 35 member B1 like n=1 Tax=Pseudolycoriella hygida TaxID=35572 RepID=A0A9Q0RX97_9DIPT|nr:Solute carrier family 35 member B1 like [Pseudolycoriella hygida]
MANVLSNVALQYIPYPTQIIGKSAKPIPVMLLGVLIGHKRYAPLKYVFVFIVVVGVFCFMFKDNYNSKDGENPALGAGVVGLSLLFDGLQGAVQDRMRFTTRPTALNYMTYVNVWSAIFLVIGMAALGEATSFFGFVVRHSEIALHLLVIVMVGAMGHICISGMITKFGALPASIVTTLRKFFTVLLSVVWYGHTLTLRQWLATLFIFGALLADAITSKTSEEDNDDTNINEERNTQLPTVGRYSSNREDEAIVATTSIS